jgi:protein-L-isoaspartate(D-aspartate) O-methyltransferase
MERMKEKRYQMVSRQLEGRDITDPRVLEAMRKVPRHRFVPDRAVPSAYEDYPLTIGRGQTISQPYIVALMTQAVSPKPDHVALEIGTGSGYQTAVLAELVKTVHSIEIIEALGRWSKNTLADYRNVHLKIGDGYEGWPDHAPYDIIMLTAAPARVPPPLFEQLAAGGCLIAPVGEVGQNLLLYRRTEAGIVKKDILSVRFVPMTGKARTR